MSEDYDKRPILIPGGRLFIFPSKDAEKMAEKIKDEIEMMKMDVLFDRWVEKMEAER